MHGKSFECSLHRIIQAVSLTLFRPRLSSKRFRFWGVTVWWCVCSNDVIAASVLWMQKSVHIICINIRNHSNLSFTILELGVWQDFHFLSFSLAVLHEEHAGFKKHISKIYVWLWEVRPAFLQNELVAKYDRFITSLWIAAVAAMAGMAGVRLRGLQASRAFARLLDGSLMRNVFFSLLQFANWICRRTYFDNSSGCNSDNIGQSSIAHTHTHTHEKAVPFQTFLQQSESLIYKDAK